MAEKTDTSRTVKAVHGLEAVAADPPEEVAESDELRKLERDAIL